METAEIKCEIEEEEVVIEGLQARRSRKLHNHLNSNNIVEEEDDDDSDYKQQINVNVGGVDDHFVSEVKSSVNEEIDLKSSEKCVSHKNIQGTTISIGLSSNGHNAIQHTAPENINGDSKADVTIKSLNSGQSLSQESELQHEKQHGSLSGSSILPSEICPEEDKTSLNFSSYKAAQNSDTNLLYASDHEVTELDVESVLRKQDTHNLYCPNCNSCITKRVIIRKRKLRLPNLGEDGKRNKLENVTGPGPVSSSVPTTSNPSHNTVDTSVDGSGAPSSNNIDQDQEPERDVFRCLSCFSIFMPTGNGFKLFRMFGDKSDKNNLQDPPQTQVLKRSWFSTLFQSDKDVETDDTEVCIPSKSVRQQNVSVSSIHESSAHAQTVLNGEPVKTYIKESLTEPGSLDKFEDQVSVNLNKENRKSSLSKSPSNAIYADGESVLSEISGSKEGDINIVSPSYYEVRLYHEGEHPGILAGIPPTTSKETAESSTFKPQENGLKFFIPSDVSSITVETSKTDQKVIGTIPTKNSDEKETAFLLQTPQSLLEESYTDSKVNITSIISSQNEQKSGASFLSKFAAQTENGELTTDDEEIHHSEDYQHNKTHEADAYTDEPLKADQGPPIPVVQNTILLQGREITIRNTLKDTAAQKTSGYQHNKTHEAEVYTDEPLKADQVPPIPVVQNTILLQGREINIRNTLKDTAAQKTSVSDTVVVVETSQIEEPDVQRVQELLNPAEIENLQHLETIIQINEQSGISTEGIQGVEIIKSIVYGGLVESISSLGVVSSAAGSDAATLNVLALGLATLFGGLIIIGHNLWELKNDKKTEASDQLDERVDRYHELLGHRRNFLLHAVFAILSFLTFGLLPPVTYGLSFRKSDDRNLKLAIVAAASLLAIIILASGKEYVKRTPKSYIKTVLYYIVMGMMVSGISYEVGNLITMLLEKLNVFQSSLIITLPEVGMKPAWASY